MAMRRLLTAIHRNDSRVVQLVTYPDRSWITCEIGTDTGRIPFSIDDAEPTPDRLAEAIMDMFRGLPDWDVFDVKDEVKP